MRPAGVVGPRAAAGIVDAFVPRLAAGRGYAVEMLPRVMRLALWFMIFAVSATVQTAAELLERARKRSG